MSIEDQLYEELELKSFLKWADSWAANAFKIFQVGLDAEKIRNRCPNNVFLCQVSCALADASISLPALAYLLIT